MKKMILSLAIAAVTLCSCGVNEINENDDEPCEHRFIDSTYNLYNGGRIIYDYMNSVSMFTDFETMETVPLCSRPNCTHKNNECVAKLVGEIPVVYDDKLFYLTHEEGVTEIKKGEREFYINSKLKSISLSSSEIITVTKFHDCAPQTDGGYYLYGKDLYFIATDMGAELNAYGSYIWSNVGGKQFLCSIDLENGQYKNYGIIYDGDTQYEGAKNSRSAFIAGGSDSKINIFYSFLPETSSVNDDTTVKDFTMLDIDFDIDTKRFSDGDIISPSFSDDECFVGYDNKKGIMIVDYNGRKKEFEVDDRDDVSVVNGKLFDVKKEIWIDLDSNKEYSMGKYSGYKAITLWNGYYILAKNTSTVKLTEEELRAL